MSCQLTNDTKFSGHNFGVSDTVDDVGRQAVEPVVATLSHAPQVQVPVGAHDGLSAIRLYPDPGICGCRLAPGVAVVPAYSRVKQDAASSRWI